MADLSAVALAEDAAYLPSGWHRESFRFGITDALAKYRRCLIPLNQRCSSVAASLFPHDACAREPAVSVCHVSACHSR